MEELAHRVGIARQSIHRIESGALHSTEALIRIYKALQLDMGLMNRYAPNEERLLEAFRLLDQTFPEVAADFLTRIVDHAEELATLRRRQQVIESEFATLIPTRKPDD